MQTTNCPQNHGRQNAIVDPSTDEVAWVCIDCGAMMSADDAEQVIS